MRTTAFILTLLITFPIPCIAQDWTSVDGQKLFKKFCAECHSESSSKYKMALQPTPLPLLAPKLRFVNSLEELKGVIANGVPPAMFGYKESLSKKQIESIAQYINDLRRSSDQSTLD